MQASSLLHKKAERELNVDPGYEIEPSSSVVQKNRTDVFAIHLQGYL